MAQTTNLDLKKPELSEAFKLEDWNSNTQKIDDWAGTVDAAVASLLQRIEALEQQNGGGGGA
jgi:hypothetical protein